MNNELKERMMKAKNQEEVADLLKSDGLDESNADKIWAEIVERQEKEGKTLSMDELEAVSGGAFWLGKDAPDGHELNCFWVWYDGWDDFDEQNGATYCKGTKGKKHDFEHCEETTTGVLISMKHVFDRCKRCGYTKNESYWRV